LTSAGWSFDWGDIAGEVTALGGMLGPVRFTLADGRKVQPFAVAPWAGDAPERLATLPPILRSLRGDFPCVPFGVPAPRHDLPPHWSKGADLAALPVDDFIHGYSANHDWHLVDRGEREIAIAVDYPDTHPVRRLERRVRAGAGPGLEMELTIEVRRDTALPVGLHPIFALPDRAGAARLEIPSLRGVQSFPVPVEEASVFQPDQYASSLSEVATRDGRSVDASALPLAVDTEELLSAHLTQGLVRLAFPDEGHAVELAWDIAVFPQCLLWLSNRGRDAYPWNGRFRAIGIEPVRSAFDLGAELSTHAETPFGEIGLATSLALERDRPFTTRYSVGVSRL
jgi:hypothetical protein